MEGSTLQGITPYPSSSTIGNLNEKEGSRTLTSRRSEMRNFIEMAFSAPGLTRGRVDSGNRFWWIPASWEKRNTISAKGKADQGWPPCNH